jgi:hypothetical protein
MAKAIDILKTSQLRFAIAVGRTTSRYIKELLTRRALNQREYESPANGVSTHAKAALLGTHLYKKGQK